MDVRFFIDIENASGDKLGNGPIATATTWQSTARMDRAGSFSFRMPAGDPIAAFIDKKRLVKCYAVEPGGIIQVGSGIIDEISTIPEEDGGITLEVSGDDLMRELTYRSVHFLELESSGAGITHAAAVSAIAAYAPAGWTFNAAASPGNNSIYYKFAGESVLAAAAKVAELSDCHFYLSGEREITFFTAWSASGIRAIEPHASPNPGGASTCYITNIQYTEDTFDLITRIYPYGAGEYDDALSLASTTRSAPTGYTLSTGSNYIENDSAATAYGRIEIVRQFKDVEPITDTPTDDISAANALFDLAIEELQRRSVPALHFGLSVASCTQLLKPSQTIRAVFRRVLDGRNVISIDQNLNILEATAEINDQGLRTTGLTVATVQRYPERDTDPIVDLVKSSQLR